MISVLTPSYNYGRFLSSCLQSVEMQATDIQHIVMDAGSGDETVELLRRSNAIWRSEPDQGQSDALNKASKLAKGEWMGWLNADEFYLPWATDWLQTVPSDVDVVYGDFVLAEEGGRADRVVKLHNLTPRTLKYYGTTLPSCATFFRRSLMVDLEWSRSLKRVMDWDLWLSFLDMGAKFHYENKPLSVFAVHDGNVTAGSMADSAQEYAQVRADHSIRDSMVLRSLGKLEHSALKLAGGGYKAEKNFRSNLKGHQMTWSSAEDAALLRNKFAKAGLLA